MNILELNAKTRSLLIAHYEKYPLMQIQDIFKFLHQSSFGCEHLVSSPEAAISYISKEYDSIDHNIIGQIEPLDGNYSRVPLSYLNLGLSSITLGKLFSLSAKVEKNGKSDLVQKLQVARDMILEKALPFSVEEFDKCVSEWEAKDFSALHHSDTFRNAYHPAYRVISNRYIPFLPLFTELDKRLIEGNVKLAIEGGSASGKSTLSDVLSQLYDCTLFHMDDFFLQMEQRTPERFAEIGGNVDRERFLSEVLIPLSQGNDVIYRKFDCSTMSLGDFVQENPKPLTVIEGAYSMHPDLRAHYDFSVFLDVSPDTQKARILKRNSHPMAQRFFNEWIPMEHKYFDGMNIPAICDMRIPIH